MDNFAEVVIPEIEPEPEEDIIKEEEPLEPDEPKEYIVPVVEEKKKLNQEEIFVRTSKKKSLEIKIKMKESALKRWKNNYKEKKRLSKAEIQKVYEAMNNHAANSFGISAGWPDRFNKG